ncbi:MAG: alkaline phosphatase D family protein [Pseudomonadota bacterium]
MFLSRRDFLRYSLSAGSTIWVSTHLTGCALQGQEAKLSRVSFSHGVASGDPEAGALILWTRAVPGDDAGVATVGWEVASDPEFSNIMRSGVATTGPERDFTVKVDVQELNAGTPYFYRFRGADSVTESGRSKTLPSGSVDRVRFAVFSCSNYPAGYFHAYGEAAQLPDIDAFLHLGDYFYEYPSDGYATERAAELGRELADDNSGELLSLIDYRRRYALYRGDRDLQTLHAAAPMIAVWDDHEIANDTWHSGAQNHQPDEGPFEERKAAAVQAYFEWMPIRPVLPDADGRIYRRLKFGDLVSLYMLDTRLIGRDQQLEYGHFMDEATGEFDVASFTEAMSDPSRSLLGEEQRLWLYGALQDSQASWDVLGQQVLMARMQLPSAFLTSVFGQRDVTSSQALLEELVEDKRRALAGQTLSETRAKRLAMATPYNLDAWDGYAVEREQLYGALAAMDKTVVAFAGDTHNAWRSDLRDRNGRQAGVELATPGVSSPGMESYLSLDESSAALLSDAMVALIDELQFCDLRQRGFMEVEFTPSHCDTTWHFIDDVTRREVALSTETHRFERSG